MNSEQPTGTFGKLPTRATFRVPWSCAVLRKIQPEADDDNEQIVDDGTNAIGVGFDGRYHIPGWWDVVAVDR
jgi:hypothetical protein